MKSPSPWVDVDAKELKLILLKNNGGSWILQIN